jgi:hypothetical protein
MVVARGEAVRNFLYSDVLSALSQQARVTLLSLVDHGEVVEQARSYVERFVPLKVYRENPGVVFLREVLHTAHYRWLWSEAVKYYWGRHNARVQGNPYETFKLYAARALAYPLANRPLLRLGTQADQSLSWRLRPTRDFEKLFTEIQPDLIFNCSHIHGSQADLPMRVAQAMGITTAAFIFSWDNLTSRSRIFVPYDFYLMWNEGMKAQLLAQYPPLKPEQAIVTGTPQFDFHFKPEFWLSRDELCRRVGLNPSRPYILYTTGMASDFPEEHRIVAAAIRYIKELNGDPRPQLLVRTYIKGTSDEMNALAASMRGDTDVVFPPILWDKQWIMPLREDLYIYTNLLRHAALGINAASTVSLELMMFDKPAINLGFEPPGANLPYYTRFARHVDYEHYRPVAQSGGVMVARSPDDLRSMIARGLSQPQADHDARLRFINEMFGEALDGCSGQRVAERLLELAGAC